MKITISVAEGDENGARVVLTDTATGSDLQTHEVKAGDDVEITVENGNRVAVHVGAPSDGDTERAANKARDDKDEKK